MYEVELRARMKGLEKIEKKLQSMGASFHSEVQEIDTYYGMKWEVNSIKLLKKRGGRINILLRIRKRIEEGKTKNIFTMKTLPSGDNSIREEVELEIGDAQRMREILKAMRALKVLTLTKRRRKYVFGKIEILLDDIDELGTWIEVAREDVPKGHLRETKEEIEKFMRRKLGIDEVETRGYFPIAVQEIL